jgi:hypothetical protein
MATMEEARDLYYLVGEKQCAHAHTERGGKRMWICERAEGHDGPHQWVPVYIPRPRASAARAVDASRF